MHKNYAQIRWLESGEPYSELFDDIYFSHSNGLEESEYVFIQQNQLPQRWLKREKFSIAELGFGSGLNFLATINCWHLNSLSNSCLNYFSFEKYPFSRNDYQQMAKLIDNHWPHLSKYHQLLAQLYPLQRPIQNIYLMDGKIKLTLFYDDACTAMENLDTLIDAWYLDGFDPKKNSQLWNQSIYQQIVKHSNQQASFSTYTAAGHVRRGLKEAGFAVKKAKGIGQKREMLTGILE